MLARGTTHRHALSTITRSVRSTRHAPAVIPSTRFSSTSQLRPRTIFSGIQPTGVPHLGNYLGALRQWKKLQDESAPDTKLIFSLVDLHAITIQQDPDQLRQWKAESLSMLLAIGLDPERCILFHQSDVPAHTELMWILSCQASTGYLSRMTQWKDKTAGVKENETRLKLGLFSYPVLQAADVLVHDATHVPVGVDQAQHLEFAREIAIGFNHVFGKGQQVLTPPDTIISPAARVKSLTDPTSKMSKSSPNPKSKILMTDSKEAISAKIKSAVTDSTSGISYDPDSRPGVSNLLDLLYYVKYEGSSTSPKDLAKEFNSSSLRILKETVAEAVNDVVQPIREQYLQIVQNESLLADIAGSGALRANENTLGTMARVKRFIGLS